jgi:hypothetical protein
VCQTTSPVSSLSAHSGVGVRSEISLAVFGFRSTGGSLRNNLDRDIRYCYVDIVSIYGRTPLHTSQAAAAADARLPQHLSLLIRIDCVDHARFLSGDQRALSVLQLDKYR